ncbi:hypothetical protein M406DRAFT_98385 [Cryphonectria parasitica EP155]|uniref:Fibronectin type-III domain-containing protein n=1 Tax=Cryphonectria parasitica (strain ATCC 38755 / EP155) TaxID=660469 RepID=A0A9P4Y1J0_CRYP1|nr:uncharacterized protein M406DRAFT_98385 [Cryphonectria parasitica EP155]KAF3764725.1 hypothetical protein M406DRAFT_98385 [Cryphonectria parasitica EP155]
MTWTSWTTLVPLLILICSVLAWSFLVEHNLDRFCEENASMLLFSAAVVWLMRRAVQTLWKPVPELIGILGVDVPDAPDVMLAGIGVDKATVNWARPHPNKPVQKFLIQVNGVVVGESPANQETAITVTGLKPSHFYNVRVIAVGANSFQAGSRTVRLRTFGRDGRPQLGNSRLPPNFEPEDQTSSSVQRENGDEGTAPRSPVPGIESATIPDGGLTLTRETSAAGQVPRRNTVGRRSSPSVGSMDQKPVRKDSTSEAEIRGLGEKFSSIKKELEDTIALVAKEEEDSKRLLDELEQEKQQKKAEQKKKEEQTEKLKKEMGTTDRAMRSAIQRKAQLEKEVKARQAERSRYEDGTAKMEKQIQEMRKERESYDEQKAAIEEESAARNKELRQSNEQLQAECSQMEADLKAKREQVRKLEEDRKKLPGGEDDAEWRQKDFERRREWARRQSEWLAKLHKEEQKGRELDMSLNSIHAVLQQIPQATLALHHQANSSGADFDVPSQNQLKRRSHHSNSLSNVGISPAPQYTALEPPQQQPGFGVRGGPPPGLGPLLLDPIPRYEDHDDEEFRSFMADAPLSPSATNLLPSNIFTDDEHDEPDSPASDFEPTSPFVPAQPASPVDHDPQSPGSGRSASIMSSPHGSMQNLQYSSFPSDDAERRSLNSHTGNFSSPLPPPGQPATNRLASLFSFQRGKPTKPLDEPPELGSLKPGQSRSFPRQLEDLERVPSRRRINLSSFNVFNRNSVGPDTMDAYPSQAGTTGFSTESFLPFGGPRRAMTGVFDRDQSSSRPASIASADRPRPSTDSSSLWPPPDQAGFGRSRLVWSPDNNSWSRNPSRRPSLHGSPSVLKTTLASADDEILDDEALLDPQVSPSQVGVIGRPGPTKKSLAKALNPAAPSFMGNIFKPKADKDSSSKEKKTKGKEVRGATGADDQAMTQPFSGNESVDERSESRQSLSVQSRTSISESHDSLSLDQSVSNTPSEFMLKEPTSPDNVVRKLFRKGSSSKFSLSSRLGGSKKGGPGSTTTNISEREHRSSFGGSDDVLGGGGSGINAAGEEFLGKSYESVNSSPSVGGGSTKAKDGRMSGRWFSMGKKKEKGRESLDIEHERMSSVDTEATPEE